MRTFFPSFPRQSADIKRCIFHGALLIAFATAGAAMLVWPQRIAADGAQAALELQHEHESDLTQRLGLVRVLNYRLRDWSRESRRVLLRGEGVEFETLVRQVARREGVKVARLRITTRPSPRWRAVSIAPVAVRNEIQDAGEIEPRTIQIVLTGTFGRVYRTIGSLCGQQALLIPDRWDLAAMGRPGVPRGEIVRAEVWATVFVARQPDDPPVPPGGSSRMAAGLPSEEIQ